MTGPGFAASEPIRTAYRPFPADLSEPRTGPSQRTYQNRVQALPSEQCEDESEQSCLFRKSESLSCTWDTGDVDAQRFGWLSSLEDELLYRRLCKLPEDDLELLTLLIVDGYRQADVARLWNCSRSAITQRINKIKIFLKKA